MVEIGIATDGDTGPTLEELRAHATEAEGRGDVMGLLIAYEKLGHALRRAEQYDEATEVLRRAATTAVGANRQDYHAMFKSNLGNILGDQGRHAEAIAEETSALELISPQG